MDIEVTVAAGAALGSAIYAIWKAARNKGDSDRVADRVAHLERGLRSCEEERAQLILQHAEIEGMNKVLTQRIDMLQREVVTLANAVGRGLFIAKNRDA